MRRNASTITLPAFAVLLVLVAISAVVKADENAQAVASVSISSVSASSVELLHDVASIHPIAKPRTLRMEVTAYCPCKKCCGKNARGITASGLRISHNAGLFVAADTALLPFHTKLIIPGYAADQAVPVLDRGGAIKGNRIDVFFPTHQQALEWGRRVVEVTVVDSVTR